MESRKNSADEPIYREGIEIQRKQTCGHNGGKRLGQTEKVVLKYIHYHV